MAQKISVRVGDMVLYRIAEGVERPMLVVAVDQTRDPDLVNGIVFCDGPRERIDIGNMRMGQLSAGIFWLVNVRRGGEVDNWYPRPLFLAATPPPKPKHEPEEETPPEE